MAERISFLKSFINSDKFVELSIEARLLYFYMCVNARDKGIVICSRMLCRMLEIGYECIDELLDSGFVIPCDENYQIVHWYENNGIGDNHKKRLNYPYRKWRNQVIERDKRCVKCGSTESLVAHHIMPFAKYPELRTDLNNGITLCDKCHKELHKEERKNGRS